MAIEVRQAVGFVRWLSGLRDPIARLRIATRMRRMQFGNPGDAKAVGDGVYEMRIDHGPGYRLYYIRQGSAVVILLCGGDKSSQQRDIAAAKLLAREIRDAR